MTDPRARRSLAWLLAGLMLIPPVVAVVTMFGHRWYPVSDLAIVDLSVRDVWSAHTPLVGLWSRPGWSHPGPLAYWLIGLFSGATGQSAWTTRVGGALVEGLAIGALAWVTWRRGLRLMLAAATVTGLMYLGTGPWIFREPWNLHIPVPFFVLFLFLTVNAAEGGSRTLIAMTFVGSLIVQTHLGYALLVATGFAWALAWITIDARRARRPPERWRSTLVLSIGVAVVVWIPPIIDQLVHSPGNLHKIAAYFLAGGHANVGLARAAGIIASEFRVVPPWLGGPDRQSMFLGIAAPSALAWLLIPAVLLVAATAAARVAGSRADLRRVALAAVLTVIAVLAVSRADEARAYTFQWRVVVAAFVVVMCLWAVADAVRDHIPRVATTVGTVGIVGIVAWGAIGPNIHATSLTRGPPKAREAALREMMTVVRARGVRSGRTILVEPYGGGLHSLFDGIVNELDRDGADVRVDHSVGRIYGMQRVGRADQADEVWYVTERGSTLPELLARPGARLVARTRPLSASQDAELARLQVELGAQLDRAGRGAKRSTLDQDLIGFLIGSVPGVDPALVTRIAALNHEVQRTGRCRCAIVAVPGGRAGSAG